MLSIANNVKYEIVINKSRFINYLIKIENQEEVKKEIDSIKQLEKGATHYCYAYILGNVKHFSDDGEPSGTAGMPMLNVLESNKLDHILSVSVRYFGGIKLGAGGLVRAYTKSVTSALEKAQIVELEKGYSFKITCDFHDKVIIENAISNLEISSINYSDKINYIIQCNEKRFLVIKEALDKNKIEISNIKEIMTISNNKY